MKQFIICNNYIINFNIIIYYPSPSTTQTIHPRLTKLEKQRITIEQQQKEKLENQMDNNIGKNVIDKHNVRGSQDSTVNEYAKNKNSSNGNYNKYQHLSGSSQHPYIKHSINSTSSLLKKLEKQLLDVETIIAKSKEEISNIKPIQMNHQTNKHQNSNINNLDHNQINHNNHNSETNGGNTGQNSYLSISYRKPTSQTLHDQIKAIQTENKILQINSSILSPKAVPKAEDIRDELTYSYSMSPCKESEISQSKSFNFEFINNNSADLNSHRNSDTIDNVTNAKTDVYNNTTYINSNYQDDEPDPSGGSMSKTVKLDSANIPRKLLFQDEAPNIQNMKVSDCREHQAHDQGISKQSPRVQKLEEQIRRQVKIEHETDLQQEIKIENIIRLQVSPRTLSRLTKNQISQTYRQGPWHRQNRQRQKQNDQSQGEVKKQLRNENKYNEYKVSRDINEQKEQPNGQETQNNNQKQTQIFEQNNNLQFKQNLCNDYKEKQEAIKYQINRRPNAQPVIYPINSHINVLPRESHPKQNLSDQHEEQHQHQHSHSHSHSQSLSHSQSNRYESQKSFHYQEQYCISINKNTANNRNTQQKQQRQQRDQSDIDNEQSQNKMLGKLIEPQVLHQQQAEHIYNQNGDSVVRKQGKSSGWVSANSEIQQLRALLLANQKQLQRQRVQQKEKSLQKQRRRIFQSSNRFSSHYPQSDVKQLKAQTEEGAVESYGKFVQSNISIREYKQQIVLRIHASPQRSQLQSLPKQSHKYVHTHSHVHTHPHNQGQILTHTHSHTHQHAQTHSLSHRHPQPSDRWDKGDTLKKEQQYEDNHMYLSPYLYNKTSELGNRDETPKQVDQSVEQKDRNKINYHKQEKQISRKDYRTDRAKRKSQNQIIKQRENRQSIRSQILKDIQLIKKNMNRNGARSCNQEIANNRDTNSQDKESISKSRSNSKINDKNGSQKSTRNLSNRRSRRSINNPDNQQQAQITQLNPITTNDQKGKQQAKQKGPVNYFLKSPKLTNAKINPISGQGTLINNPNNETKTKNNPAVNKGLASNLFENEPTNSPSSKTNIKIKKNGEDSDNSYDKSAKNGKDKQFSQIQDDAQNQGVNQQSREQQGQMDNTCSQNQLENILIKRKHQKQRQAKEIKCTQMDHKQVKESKNDINKIKDGSKDKNSYIKKQREKDKQKEIQRLTKIYKNFKQINNQNKRMINRSVQPTDIPVYYHSKDDKGYMLKSPQYNKSVYGARNRSNTKSPSINKYSTLQGQSKSPIIPPQFSRSPIPKQSVADNKSVLNTNAKTEVNTKSKLDQESREKEHRSLQKQEDTRKDKEKDMNENKQISEFRTNIIQEQQEQTQIENEGISPPLSIYFKNNGNNKKDSYFSAYKNNNKAKQKEKGKQKPRQREKIIESKGTYIQKYINKLDKSHEKTGKQMYVQKPNLNDTAQAHNSILNSHNPKQSNNSTSYNSFNKIANKYQIFDLISSNELHDKQREPQRKRNRRIFTQQSKGQTVARPAKVNTEQRQIQNDKNLQQKGTKQKPPISLNSHPGWMSGKKLDGKSDVKNIKRSQFIRSMLQQCYVRRFLSQTELSYIYDEFCHKRTPKYEWQQKVIQKIFRKIHDINQLIEL